MTMVRFSTFAILLLAGSILFSCSKKDVLEFIDNYDQQEKQFMAELSGANELPDAVESDASGQTLLKVSKDGKKIYFTITVAKLNNYLAGHIHVAPPTENGPVVAWLFPIEPYPFPNFVDDPLIPGTFNGVLAEGVITEDHLSGPLEGMSMEALITELEAGNAYVNLHTSQYPGGEIRGNF